MKNHDLYAGDYNIDTPERVAFDYTIADIGNRFLAAFVDIVLVGMALLGLNGVLLALLAAAGVDPGAFGFEDETLGWAGGLAIAVYAALNFLVIWGYFMLLELKWNGQTVGKKLVGIRVVRVDGSPAGNLETAVRNLVRIVDFMPTAYLIGFVTMLFNSQARRLGDLAGGTLVVKVDAPITLDQLVRAAEAARSRAAPVGAVPPVAPPPAPASLPADVTLPVPPADQEEAPAPASLLDVRGLRPGDYALILDVLGRDARSPLQDALLVRLATAIAARIGYTADVDMEPRAFLSRVAEAYRRKG